MSRTRQIGSGALSLLLGGIAGYWAYSLPVGQSLIARLTQTYALTALGLLYISLLISPLYAAFPKLKWKKEVILLRRPLGVTVCICAIFHASLGFFGELGGFHGLVFLTSVYLYALSFSTIALLILLTMALTSTDCAVRSLGTRWKLIHRFVYLAGFLILIHALLLGSNFTDLSSITSKISYFLLVILFAFEAYRIDSWLNKRTSKVPKLGVITVLIAAISVYVPLKVFSGGSGRQVTGLNVHAQHIQIALENQNPTTTYDTSSPAFAGLRGDRTKRYTVSFEHGPSVPGGDTQLTFEVYNAASGNPVISFATIYTKLLHLVIVDSSLQYYSHIHPIVHGNQFVITTQFPHSGRYHLYIDYQPFGAIEQQQGFTIDVGGSSDAPLNQSPIDSGVAKQFEGSTVSMVSDGPLSATRLSKGDQIITFDVKNATTGQPRNDLTPYLGAFGHLVMINTQTFEFVHVHPDSLTVPAPDAHGGPTVTFLPLGLYEAIKPGTYRIFGQFQPGGHIITTDFTAQVR